MIRGHEKYLLCFVRGCLVADRLDQARLAEQTGCVMRGSRCWARIHLLLCCSCRPAFMHIGSRSVPVYAILHNAARLMSLQKNSFLRTQTGGKDVSVRV